MIDRLTLQELLLLSDQNRIIDLSPVTEIQTKALVTESDHTRLEQLLADRYGNGSEVVMIQTRYRERPGGAGDLRLRLFLEEKKEIKEGESPYQTSGGQLILKEETAGHDVSADSRIEIKEPITDKSYGILRRAFSTSKQYHDPSWIKHALNFFTDIDGEFGSHRYRLSLQYLTGPKEPLGHVLEGSIKFQREVSPEEKTYHKEVIRSVFTSIGVQEDKEHFNRNLALFITQNS